MAAIETIGAIVLDAAIVYVAVIVFTRLGGLRSFAKMSSFDFAMTVAIGSVIASTVASTATAAWQGVTALAAIYALQIAVAYWRTRSSTAQVVDNSPLLLMTDGQILEDNLKTGNVTPQELRAKLREANVLRYDQVRAVVLETTGDVAVLHSTDDDVELDLDLLQDVRDVEQFPRR
ncbi:MAG: DUF421 domain-containing protein [Nitriliruptorales bacterium]|nr:DUF421 domain-containing protein [Nitriliruptorales bacterium]